ncbi:hypothetical protein [Pseudomonas serbica]|jgi:hypothetical protein|uniref:hypothetical protein n=1 Tax=Pseudomonas serbica TaxID=2965074 RepID=UPI00237AEADA|nr:hypothetical protein [Pseudomonas serbica]
MDVESFEPSDEMMALINERLAPGRAANAERRDRLQAKYGEGAPIQFFAEPDYPGDMDTAYARNLKHKCLLRELQVLGLEVWERTGKKAQFDAITELVIGISRAPSERMSLSFNSRPTRFLPAILHDRQ